MIIRSQRQLENTRTKLRELEKRYQRRKQAPMVDEHIRTLALISFRQLINQLTEEIGRYEAGVEPQPHCLQTEQTLENTRRKLYELEALYRRRKEDTTETPYVRKLSLQSLKRTINQLKEEIVRFEAHAKVKN